MNETLLGLALGWCFGTTLPYAWECLHGGMKTERLAIKYLAYTLSAISFAAFFILGYGLVSLVE